MTNAQAALIAAAITLHRQSALSDEVIGKAEDYLEWLADEEDPRD